MRSEAKPEIESLKTNDEKVKSELIRQMFIFWVGQIGAILGILFAFLMVKQGLLGIIGVIRIGG